MSVASSKQADFILVLAGKLQGREVRPAMSMQPGDHVRPHGGRRVHKLGDLAPTDSCPTKAICGAMMWSDGHVTDRPVTCQKCIRHQALAEMVGSEPGPKHTHTEEDQ